MNETSTSDTPARDELRYVPKRRDEPVTALFVGPSDASRPQWAAVREHTPCRVSWDVTTTNRVRDELDETVDVVVLHADSGFDGDDALLASVRERSPDCFVVVTVPDDVDVSVAAADEVIVRPLSDREVADAVMRYARRRAYRRLTQRHFTIASKLAELEAAASIAELESDDRYAKLDSELTEVERQCADLVDEFEDEDFVAAFREFYR